MKRITLGLLAHVDGGKTTLSEALLYTAGAIRTMGRVDKGEACLDFDPMERERGITIFARSASLFWKDTHIQLLDTPGHGDFAGEMERVLPVLDCALLVISGSDGPQAHTRLVFELLKKHAIPCFVFISKMDISYRTEQEHLQLLKDSFGEGFVSFQRGIEEEELSLLHEDALEEYLAEGCLSAETVRGLIEERRLFPLCFGSGLKGQGLERLLDILALYAPVKPYKQALSALVYKVDRDEKGLKWSHIKLLGGSLSVRDGVSYTDKKGESRTEKIQQLRFYQGQKYENRQQALAGELTALSGLSAAYPGMYIGEGDKTPTTVLSAPLSYRLRLPSGVEAASFMPKLRELEQEEPNLQLRFDAALGEIRLQMMGRVQTEVFLQQLKRRFGVEAALDKGRVLYKETVLEPVLCAGHYEPLRHYGEVHLLLEPLPLGSGVILESRCPENALSHNWQNLVLSQLAARELKGRLTGSPLADVRISLTGGCTHVKHTEGGDMAQAALRALRQGLMKVSCALLEPYYSFIIELPTSQMGRVLGDIKLMGGSCEHTEQRGERSLLTGRCPIATMENYHTELLSFTGGQGSISCFAEGYAPCHNQQEVIESFAYDPQRDIDNPADSVFCIHGAGRNISWQEADSWMHGRSAVQFEKEPLPGHRQIRLEDRELREIMKREFGQELTELYRPASSGYEQESYVPVQARPNWLLVDGYNVIFAWEELKTLAKGSIEAARMRLMDHMSNYCGFTGSNMILVFDGYDRPNNQGSRFDYHGVQVLFTKEGLSADGYLEKLLSELGHDPSLRLVTGDGLIQLWALGNGIVRTSAREFEQEFLAVQKSWDRLLKQKQKQLSQQLSVDREA